MRKKPILEKVCSYLHEIFDSVSDAVVIVDMEPTPHLALINKLACEILNIKTEDGLGKIRNEYVGGLVGHSLIDDLLREGKERSGLIYTKDGLELFARTRPVFDDNGSLNLS